MPNAPIIGITSGYIPAEYPKVVHDRNGKTALARNPDHLADLEDEGWTEEYVSPPLPPPPAKVAASSELQAELLGAKATINQLTKELMAAVTKHDSITALWTAAVAELDKLKNAVPAPPPPPDEPEQAEATPPRLKVPLGLKKQ